MLEFEFSSHGAGMIHAYRWEPEGQPLRAKAMPANSSQSGRLHTVMAKTRWRVVSRP